MFNLLLVTLGDDIVETGLSSFLRYSTPLVAVYCYSSREEIV
jgi:hypothetical protein